MVQKFRTAADIAVASSAAYAVFGAVLAYPAVAPAATALAFATGYGALLFLLPLSVFALEFLRPPRRLDQAPRSIVACAVATPVALLAAVLAEPCATAASAVWAVDAVAAAALGWCLTNGGLTPVAFSRRMQFANFMDAARRMPDIGYPPDRRRRPAGREALRGRYVGRLRGGRRGRGRRPVVRRPLVGVPGCRCSLRATHVPPVRPGVSDGLLPHR